ncbi:hypothetical protein QS257_19305 [Terrilactibacillus sp. S3-3]|nr:hypothetical protein QS257_19305 [Terrilactibacillus sp. S3-3]
MKKSRRVVIHNVENCNEYGGIAVDSAASGRAGQKFLADPTDNLGG